MKVIITIEGGNVQSVFTDVDCDVEVIDFDTEKIPKDKLTKIPDRIVGMKEAFVYTWSTQDTNPERVKELMEAIKK